MCRQHNNHHKDPNPKAAATAVRPSGAGTASGTGTIKRKDREDSVNGHVGSMGGGNMGPTGGTGLKPAKKRKMVSGLSTFSGDKRTSMISSCRSHDEPRHYYAQQRWIDQRSEHAIVLIAPSTQWRSHLVTTITLNQFNSLHRTIDFPLSLFHIIAISDHSTHPFCTLSFMFFFAPAYVNYLLHAIDPLPIKRVRPPLANEFERRLLYIHAHPPNSVACFTRSCPARHVARRVTAILLSSRLRSLMETKNPSDVEGSRRDAQLGISLTP
ncbi:hypothetical protein AG1IA_05589 [Rhizoctonia solani AG-1 IA]|uniref:Uncharacterized protein n=1 Tax=Thanatephorus cucumeris (strain AG1-IA) TaxID=983506 RepID=L8WUE9_THACA|nr:hypothetical protein AG1IA_05589 [Rhizoctonia solani AG-1 IA]